LGAYAGIAAGDGLAGMRALVGVTAAILTLLVIAAGASAIAHAPLRPPVHMAATVVWTAQVGPGGSAAEHPAQVPVSSGGASQLVSGVTQSTNAVRFTRLGQPVYYGTEPALMTFARRGAQLVVTVAPR
jgi:hypothetical protein